MTPAQKVVKERIKRNLKEMRDKHVEWDSFQDSANYALNSIRNIAEYEQTLYTRPNNMEINLNTNNNPDPLWVGIVVCIKADLRIVWSHVKCLLILCYVPN